MSAWANQFNTKGKIRMLADPSANFSKAVDLTIELPPLGMYLLLSSQSCDSVNCCLPAKTATR